MAGGRIRGLGAGAGVCGNLRRDELFSDGAAARDWRARRAGSAGARRAAASGGAWDENGGAGVVGGNLGALAATRAMTALLFEVRPSDPLTYGVIAALLTMA